MSVQLEPTKFVLSVEYAGVSCSNVKGEFMKKYARILSALTLFLGLGVAANAGILYDTVVTVPFEFVVAGKTLPAGTYKVGHVSDNKFNSLILTNRDTGHSVFVLPSDNESTSTDMPQVSFQRVGGEHFLSAIETRNDVYNIPVSRSAIMEAATRSHDNVFVSGGSGSN